MQVGGTGAQDIGCEQQGAVALFGMGEGIPTGKAPCIAQASPGDGLDANPVGANS